MASLGTGSNLRTGQTGQLVLSDLEREQSTYVIGTTGTGKTTLLRNIAIEDMWAKPKMGLCVLDPHGDLTDELLGWVPPERIDDVIFFNPYDIERPLGLNLLECDRKNEHEVRWVASTIIETLHRLFWYSWGPRLEHVLHHVIKTGLAVDDTTMVELLLILTNMDYRMEIIGKSQESPGRLDPTKDFLLINFWYEWFLKLQSSQRVDVTASTINKLSPFLLDSMMRHIIGQQKSSFDLRKVMDEGKILFVNLSKGDIGENNSALLGSVLVNLILIGALRRRGEAYQQGRRRFHVIVDEYQNFANPSFAILQSEARKFGVDLIVAHQYRDQLDLDSLGASLNVGNIICFRVSGRDSYALASQFDNTPPPAEIRHTPYYEVIGQTAEGREILTPAYTDGGRPLYGEKEERPRPYNDVEAEMANRLSTLNNFEAFCRLIRRPSQSENYLGEYKLRTDAFPPVAGREDSGIREECKARSRERYGRDRKEVEKQIFERTGGRIDAQLPPDRGLVDPDE